MHGTFAGRLSVGERLEQHVVAPDQGKLQQQEEGNAVCADGRRRPRTKHPVTHREEQHNDADERRKRDGGVDQSGNDARSDAGHLVRNDNQLGRLDIHGGGETAVDRTGRAWA
jgi:hypothetical protein